MTLFVKVTTVDHTGKRETMRLQILSESATWLRGWKVNAEGDTIGDYYDKDGVLHQVEYLIDKGAIVKRVPLVHDLKYGTLKEAK